MRRAAFGGPLIDLLERLAHSNDMLLIRGASSVCPAETDQELILRFFALHDWCRFNVGPLKGGQGSGSGERLAGAGRLACASSACERPSNCLHCHLVLCAAGTPVKKMNAFLGENRWLGQEQDGQGGKQQVGGGRAAQQWLQLPAPSFCLLDIASTHMPSHCGRTQMQSGAQEEQLFQLFTTTLDAVCEVKGWCQAVHAAVHAGCAQCLVAGTAAGHHPASNGQPAHQRRRCMATPTPSAAGPARA